MVPLPSPLFLCCPVSRQFPWKKTLIENKQTNEQTNKQTNKQKNKQTNKQKNKQTNKQTKKQTNKQKNPTKQVNALFSFRVTKILYNRTKIIIIHAKPNFLGKYFSCKCKSQKNPAASFSCLFLPVKPVSEVAFLLIYLRNKVKFIVKCLVLSVKCCMADVIAFCKCFRCSNHLKFVYGD